jgi:hypothetical protein
VPPSVGTSAASASGSASSAAGAAAGRGVPAHEALLLDLAQREREAADELVEGPGQARDRVGDDADQLAVEDLTRRKPRDVADVLGGQRGAVHEAALEGQQLGLAP